MSIVRTNLFVSNTVNDFISHTWPLLSHYQNFLQELWESSCLHSYPSQYLVNLFQPNVHSHSVTTKVTNNIHTVKCDNQFLVYFFQFFQQNLAQLLLFLENIYPALLSISPYCSKSSLSESGCRFTTSR